MVPLTAFLTGLSTGGLSCLAVQGGLLLGLLARRREENSALSRWQLVLLPVAAFLIAKIAIHTLFGLGLGLVGERLQITATARIWLQSFAALFMVATGVRLIWPRLLPWLTFTPPASVRRLVRRNARSEAIIAPATLGLLTILIPCGTTIAMETAAVASGSVLKAAAIMFAFTLGTVPLFFLIGVLAKGTAILQRRLSYAAALLVIGVGLYSFNGVLVMTDSPFSLQNETAAWRNALGGQNSQATSGVAAATNPTITVLPNGYVPNVITVPAGQPVNIALKANGRLGCTSVFRIPKLNIQTQVDPQATTTVAATFPSPGAYTFSCGMGMYTGTINAV